MHTKKTWKKVWYFIWKDNSAASWIVNVILAFVLIKFIFFPVLGFLLGTEFPIVAVVSESMEHRYGEQKNIAGMTTGRYKLCDSLVTEKPKFDPNIDNYWKICGQWYEKKGISKKEFKEFKFPNGFNKGDIIVLIGKGPEEIKTGDILVFRSQKQYPIIHRVVNINKEYKITTKGDNNANSIKGQGVAETNISKERILGVGVIRIPLLGWVKVGFSELVGAFGIQVT